ncbi:MAG: ribosome-associated ATPase/putative transporter RbbA [Rhodomicrobium sp.]
MTEAAILAPAPRAGQAGRPIVARLCHLSHHYGRVAALEDVTLDIPAGIMAGFIGPDGVGKSSLLAIIAGARQIETGEAEVLGGDMRSRAHRSDVCPRIAYMPQGLGKNLYPDLSIRENIEFFGRLFGQSAEERDWRIADLLQSTGLTPFADRPAKKLSGGMRQKLGLCCSLIHDPELLILDEPTTGVDPLSRRQFWELIGRMRERQPGMSVLVATAYMEEAERFDWLVAMSGGQVLATGAPSEIKARAGTESIEDAFIRLLPEKQRAGHHAVQIPPWRAQDTEAVVVARGLTRKFGDFTAVDDVSFTIERGEIFGFVGSNGCGKTTTMKMLTGLLPASAGEAFLFGEPIDANDISLRRRVGYMSQSFSLYSELTVRQNLELHARLFHIPKEKAETRILELLSRFELSPYLNDQAESLPLGIRQRLSLAVALVHEPDMLILDEPTSGVDPIARDRFWEILIELSRAQGVTIFVSTHFMNEAARCDRIALMDAGRVLITGTPAEIVASRGADNLEDAFISYLKQAEVERGGTPGASKQAFERPNGAGLSGSEAAPSPLFSFRRLFAYSIRETLELRRDPIRLSFAVLGTAFLMLIFGFGITTDVNNLSWRVLDRDNSPESRAFLEELRGSPYFTEKAPLANALEEQRALKDGSVNATIEMPPGFGRDLKAGRTPEIGVWVDGAMPFRAETMRQYLTGVYQSYLNDAALNIMPQQKPLSVTEVRFRYNQSFDSIYAQVPGTMALELALIPAILMALAVVREKELGTITNLYVTPVSRIEFLIGKQIPYAALAFWNFILMALMAWFVFHVPLKGSFLALSMGALVFVMATTGYGMFISSFTRTQIAALFGTAILTVLPATQFSGMMVPVSSLSGFPAFMGHIFPMTYFVPICVGAYTKGLGFADLIGRLGWLSLFVPALLLLSLLFLRKQER